ncbi:MAG: pilus assembly protein PilM, partial [Candidatus Brocadiae bacterium]|nr:pilus assembly protein PilM [Candidatus Brocadiia bacterium]
MARTIWGMDFGDWALKVVRASYDIKSGSITVDLFDEIVYGDLPCGFEVGPQEKHRAGIIAFRSKYEIAPGDDLCVSVSGSEVFSRFINLPPVPESIDEIIRYEARQQIPFDIDDVVWDYQPVKEEQDLEIGEEIECGLFALKKERVEELMDLLEPWRKNLRVVQNAPLAVYNLLEYEGLVGEAAVVVDIGSATTDVLVLNPPRFWVRTLLLAGDDLTRA